MKLNLKVNFIKIYLIKKYICISFYIGTNIYYKGTKNNLQIDTTDTNLSESQNSFPDYQNSLESDNDDSDKELKIMTDISQTESSGLQIVDKTTEENDEITKSGNDSEDKSQSRNLESKNEFYKKDTFSGLKNKKKDISDEDNGNIKKKKSKNFDSDTKSSTLSSHKEYRSPSSSSSRRDKKNKSPDNDKKNKLSKETKEKINDDHFALRQKITRRKSTDSNDGENNYKNSTSHNNTSNVSTAESINNSKSSDRNSDSPKSGMNQKFAIFEISNFVCNFLFFIIYRNIKSKKISFRLSA